MEVIRKIIRNKINKLFENVQLADKVYFNTKKLSPEVKNLIISKITNGDNFTKIITDIYFEYLKQDPYTYENGNDILKPEKLNELKSLYQNLKNYNKNLFPIKGMDIFNPDNILEIIHSFLNREKIIKIFKRLPSIALRNMKEDVKKERTASELLSYFKDLEYFFANYSQIFNRDENMQKTIYQKIFKSNTTLEDIMQFVDDKESFLGGAEFKKDDIKKMALDEEFEVIYEQGNAMIIRVDSPDGIKAIGCNSLWCFTYGNGFDNAYRMWSEYSYNDQVYVIVDFREESDSSDFMHVLIKPLTDEDGELQKYTEENEDEIPLYNMANQNYLNPYYVLKSLFGNNYEKIINKYLNFNY